jgi:hypothetical protein
LAVVPDALAEHAPPPGGAIALIDRGNQALVAPTSFSSWTPLVSVGELRRAAPDCGVTKLDAVAILPNGAPLVATGCSRGGRVGIFTQTAGSWQRSGITLGGSLRGSATEVLRLAVTGSTMTALVSASPTRRSALVALWRTSSAPWTASAPLAVPSRASVLSSAIGASGALAVLMGAAGGRRVAVDITAGGLWTQLPGPPARTTALALPAGPETIDNIPIDAFTVDGSSLSVFALTPSGTKWARVQSSQVPLSYGSSG